ncbi:MAG: hypothetical protein ACP5NF_06290 [Thermoanaerobaculum sp.]
MTWLTAFRRGTLQGRVEGHGLAPGGAWWRFEVAIPYRLLPAVARQLAGFVGRRAESLSCTLGWVGLAPGEPPHLLAFAPNCDLLARHFLMSTVENPGHLQRQLWLFLAPGVYVAQLVDPEEAYDFRPEAVMGLLAAGTIREAVFLDPAFARRHFALRGWWLGARGHRRTLVAQLRALLAGTEA